MESHAQRVALVTGGGAGIGRAVALRLASDMFQVVVADSRYDAALETCRLIQKDSACKAFRADVGQADDVENLVQFAVAAFGRLDVAVNNAGIEGERAKVAAASVDVFDRVMQVNCRGVFLCMRAELRQMLAQLEREGREQQHGPGDSETAASPAASAAEDLKSAELAARDVGIDKHPYAIVNVSSTAGQSAMPEFAAYCASKHAILGLTRSAAREYAAEGVRVNAVLPGTTLSEMVGRFEAQWPEWQRRQNASYPAGRITRAEEVAAAVSWLCSRECPAVVGHCLVVDGAGSV